MSTISLIIATLNAAKTLERCIQSIINQVCVDHEIIIMDGGSTDGSIELIKSYNDRIAYWESKPDNGIYHAWNKALKHAQGEWICFIGADDYLYNKNVLSNLKPHFEKSVLSGTRILYGLAIKVDPNGKIVKTVGTDWKKIKWLLPHGMPIIHSGTFHHRSLFDIHGYFDESFKIAGDYEFLLRELLKQDALFINLRTICHQTRGLSDKKKIETIQEVAKARRMHNLPKISVIWALVYIRELIKKTIR